jgi:3'-phosphoadenosine 5'-phosphosulfate sulfotransferase (PAPS reductase)/FAD synthetase
MTNPYILPQGNVLISFSGGRTSGFMLRQIIESNNGIPVRAKVVFANTGREMPETLDFVHECGERWNVPITWLEYARADNKVTFDVVNHNSASRRGEPFDAVLAKTGILPNVFRRFCTQELKVKTIKRYLASVGWKNWTNTVGIRADERHRVKPSSDNRWTNWFPLAVDGMTKRDVMEFWSKQPFDLRVVKGGGNCDGCFLKSEATLAAMWREHPERMQWWADVEQRKSQQTGKKCSFHDSRTYADLGSFVAKQGDWIFDDESFLCQTDGGECTG